MFDAQLAKPVRRSALQACLIRLLKPSDLAEIVDGPSAKADQPAPTAAARGVGRLLLIEDNAVNREIAVAMLTRAGYAVEAVNNGAVGVAAAAAGDFDAILMDIQMPDMDGLEATRRIRAQAGPGARVPIIAMTAHAMAGAREQYLAVGMDDYVTKPVRRADLFAVIERWTKPASAIAASNRAIGPTTDGASDFDDDQLKALEVSVGQSTFRSLIEAYVNAAADRLGRMHALARAADLAGLTREAHDLKSNSGNFGVRRVYTLAKRLEAACGANDRAAALALVSEIDDATVVALATIRGRFLAQSA